MKCECEEAIMIARAYVEARGWGWAKENPDVYEYMYWKGAFSWDSYFVVTPMLRFDTNYRTVTQQHVTIHAETGEITFPVTGQEGEKASALDEALLRARAYAETRGWRYYDKYTVSIHRKHFLSDDKYFEVIGNAWWRNITWGVKIDTKTGEIFHSWKDPGLRYIE